MLRGFRDFPSRVGKTFFGLVVFKFASGFAQFHNLSFFAMPQSFMRTDRG
jgi:hypothetical protein